NRYGLISTVPDIIFSPDFLYIFLTYFLNTLNSSGLAVFAFDLDDKEPSLLILALIILELPDSNDLSIKRIILASLSNKPCILNFFKSSFSISSSESIFSLLIIGL